MSNVLTRRSLLAAAPAALAAAPRRPNFIVLFADDMGYGDLACYGHPTIRTPNLDRMAAEGTRFTSFYAAASVCTPSRAGLLTGRYPARVRQTDNFGPDSKDGLNLAETLLPQALKTQGYRTAAIGKWHLGHQPEYLPTRRGFDSYFGLPYSNDMIRPFVQTDRPLRFYRDAQEVEGEIDQTTLTERYTEEARNFIKASGRNPFFLYMPYAMPHLPVSAGARFRGRSRAGLYGDVIEQLDWSAGEILATLAQQGIDRDTCVVFCSDNGPWLNLPPRMLQKGNEPWHAGSPGPLRGSKGTSYEGGFRVPGIFRWPGRVRSGAVTAEMASTLDLFTTFTRLAGAPPPARTMDSLDLMPLLEGARQSSRRDLFYTVGNRLEALREEQWKCRTAAQGDAELYDLDADPSERSNIASRHPSVVAQLRSRMRAFAAETGAITSA